MSVLRVRADSIDVQHSIVGDVRVIQKPLICRYSDVCSCFGDVMHAMQRQRARRTPRTSVDDVAYGQPPGPYSRRQRASSAAASCCSISSAAASAAASAARRACSSGGMNST